jgi:hypothetical protein
MPPPLPPRVIHKITVPLDEGTPQSFAALGEVAFLDAQIQNGELCIWYVLDRGTTPMSGNIHIVGTGHEIPEDVQTYLATVQDGSYVWHVFLGGF